VRGICQDPAYDGERKRTLRADHSLCCQFASRWSRESQIAEGDKHLADIDRRYRIVCLRHGDTGEETHYLWTADVDGDFTVGFSSDAKKAWRGNLEKASLLVDVIRSTTATTRFASRRWPVDSEPCRARSAEARPNTASA
jgi:hypothetical protein